MKKTSLFIALALFLFASCNKKDKVMSKTDILTSGTWKITALVEDNDGNGSYETDVYALLQPCTKDDYYTFRSGGQLEMNEGPSKCDPADPQTDNVNWQFTNNETKINIDGSAGRLTLLRKRFSPLLLLSTSNLFTGCNRSRLLMVTGLLFMD